MALTKNVNGRVVVLTAAEEAALRAEWSANEAQAALELYKRLRAEAYPSVEEQLDLLHKDMMNGTTVWRDTIQGIKNQYPKPV